MQNQVESGKYTSASEVIQAALRMFVQQQDTYQGRFEELQKEIMIGIEASRRGEVVDADSDHVLMVLERMRSHNFSIRTQATSGDRTKSLSTGRSQGRTRSRRIA
ncbi:MAG: type II toxin-antitoxin system ParD family antitoxin [Rhizonema sp. NSF051]|nr:type II toxin-antitoxin system ParD family antitoxin [Rhizonema sp. NSF051]